MLIDVFTTETLLMRIEEDLMIGNLMKQAELNHDAGLITHDGYKDILRKLSNNLTEILKNRSGGGNG